MRLAHLAAGWHQRAMERPSKPLAGGCLLSGAILVGAVAGVLSRQPTIGLLAGLGVGLVLLGLVWLGDSYFSRSRRK